MESTIPETLAQLKRADEGFFEEVKRQQVLQDALQRHGLIRHEISPRKHNSVIVITKDEWTLPRLAGQAKRLNIHFEARKRDEFRLEIGLDPYEGNIESKRDLLLQLQRVMEQKTRIIGKLRSRLVAAELLPANIHGSTAYLPQPGEVRSHTIVKFTGNLPVEPTHAQAAHLFADVINAVAPIVEAELAAHYGGGT